MDDAELVRATRAGDRSAFTAIFDRHAARVHDLALAMLRDRNAALEVVESTFLEASLRLHALEEAHRLAVWLLAITRRNGALRAGATAGVDRQPSLPNDDPERVRLAGLVWEAVADLPLRDRTLIDLDLRQGLAGQDLADALGVTLPQVNELQARMRDRIEKGLAGHLVARTTDGRCAGLTKVLKGWDGRFTPKDSRRIADHVEKCTVCTQTRFSLPSPFALYASALPAPFPAMVRPRVIERAVLPVAPGPEAGLPPTPAHAGLDPATAPYQVAYVPPVPVADPSPFQVPPAPVPVALPPPDGPAPAPFPEPSSDAGADAAPPPHPEPAPMPAEPVTAQHDPFAMGPAAEPDPVTADPDPFPAAPAAPAAEAEPAAADPMPPPYPAPDPVVPPVAPDPVDPPYDPYPPRDASSAGPPTQAMPAAWDEPAEPSPGAPAPAPAAEPPQFPLPPPGPEPGDAATKPPPAPPAAPKEMP